MSCLYSYFEFILKFIILYLLEPSLREEDNIPSLTENQKLSVETKEKNVAKSDVSSVKKPKTIQNEDVSNITSSVKEAEQMREHETSPIKKKASSKKHSKRGVSHKRRSSRKEGYEGYGSDDSASVHSKSSTIYIECRKEKTKSSSQSPKKISKHERSSKCRVSKEKKYEDYNSDDSVHSGYSRRKSPEENKERSRSRSAEDRKVNIKRNLDDENLYGRYFCKVSKLRTCIYITNLYLNLCLFFKCHLKL